MGNLAFASAFDSRNMLDTCRISASEILEECAAQIDRHNAALNALVTLDLDQAREAAKNSDAAAAPIGLLNGIPIAVKNIYNTRGLRSTLDNCLYKDHVPDFDDIIVK